MTTDADIRRDPDGVTRIYDPLRRKYVALTPEEWVRQMFTKMLVGELGYPAALMANEIGLTLNGTRRRCDTVVFDRAGRPLVIVEYKAPTVNITQAVFDQIVRYNMVLRARCLMVSNGRRHFCALVDYDSHTCRFLPSLPDYPTLLGL